MFSAWTGFGVFCGYAAIAIIAGAILFRAATPDAGASGLRARWLRGAAAGPGRQ